MFEYINRTALGIGYADPKVFIIPAYAVGWNAAIQLINEAPAADVAPVRHGKWIFVNPPTELVDWEECSACGYKNFNFSRFKYCPNCGAKMDEEECEEND